MLTPRFEKLRRKRDLDDALKAINVQVPLERREFRSLKVVLGQK